MTNLDVAMPAPVLNQWRLLTDVTSGGVLSEALLPRQPQNTSTRDRILSWTFGDAVIRFTVPPYSVERETVYLEAPLSSANRARGRRSDLLQPPIIASEGQDTEPNWLRACIAELSKIDHAAAEESIETPSETAKLTARLVLQHLVRFEQLPVPVVYPTDNHTVAIYITKPRSFVLVHCESSGETVCFATIEGKRTRGRFEDGEELLEGFLDDQIKKLIHA